MKVATQKDVIKGLVELKDGEDIVILENGVIELPYIRWTIDQAVELVGKLQKAVEISRSD